MRASLADVGARIDTLLGAASSQQHHEGKRRRDSRALAGFARKRKGTFKDIEVGFDYEPEAAKCASDVHGAQHTPRWHAAAGSRRPFVVCSSARAGTGRNARNGQQCCGQRSPRSPPIAAKSSSSRRKMFRSVSTDR